MNIPVQYTDQPYSVEIGCKHRNTHQEVVSSSYWSEQLENSYDLTSTVTVCDTCDETVEPLELEECAV